MSKSTCSKQHSKPCQTCPWRRKSLAGYLGATTPEQFLAAAQDPVENRMPCHMKVNYNDKKWRDQVSEAPQCAGRAIFLANDNFVPKTTRVMREPQIKPDAKTVFASGEEFLVHHKGGVKPPSRRRKEKPKPDFFAGLTLPEDRIEAEIIKLRHIKPLVKRFNGFGDDNHQAIETQIEVLQAKLTYARTVDKYREHPCFEAAVEASDFIANDNDVDSLAGKDGWASIAAPR